jgi:hypothetical protein
MSGGNTLFKTIHYTEKVIYTGQEVMLYLSPYTTLSTLHMYVRRQIFVYHLTTLSTLYIHVRRQIFVYHHTLHWQGCLYTSEVNTLFITLHYTANVIYTCQEVILYLPSEVNTLFITLHYTANVIYACQEVILYLPSKDNTLFITLHYTDNVICTCQDVILYLSPYTTLTKLFILGLIKMSAFDWSMTRWYKTHATGW